MSEVLELLIQNQPLETSKGSRLLAVAEKLMPQSASGKVRRHLETLAGMAESAHEDGFELLVEEGINKMGSAGRIEVKLVAYDWPNIETALIEDMFNNDNLAYVDAYPDEKSIREAYNKARERTYSKIGMLATRFIKEGKLVFAEKTEKTAAPEEKPKKAA